MDLEQRLNDLERHHDWNSLLEALEQGLGASTDATAQAALHLRLGRLLHTHLVQGVKALKHFQDAFKLNAALSEALVEARNVYWELGKLNMVQKLLELQLKNAPSGQRSAELYCELGDVLCDLDAIDAATEAYAKALQVASGAPTLAGDLLHDIQVGAEEWQDRMGELLRGAHQAESKASKAYGFLRAARIVRRFAPDDVEGILGQAYATLPAGLASAAMFEGLLIAQNRSQDLLARQREILAEIEDAAERSTVAHAFGVRWALRQQNHEVAAELAAEALASDPTNDAAFSYLREYYGGHLSDWERVVSLAEQFAEAAGDHPAAAYMLAVGGDAAWKHTGDMLRARALFERAAARCPELGVLRDFEAQIGGSLTAEKGPGVASASVAPSDAAEGPAEVEAAEAGSEDEATAAAEASEASEDSGSSQGAGGESEAPASASGATAAASGRTGGAAPPGAAESGPADEGRIAELRQQLQQQGDGGRHHEYVKTLVALGEAVADPFEKAALFSEAAELYVNKFVNQAEAVRAYERVLEVDPGHAQAVEYLSAMYEKRRDWEKLIQLKQRQAEQVDAGPARVQMFKDIALLATEKVKKPEVCTALWAVVLENDPDDFDALQALSQLYERSRDYESLAGILERLVGRIDDIQERIQLLTKLGQIAGDRLKDEERAAEAYRMLLTLSPDDRRAQEQLKKRYVALGRWDDLEVFYADTGKWDEFIRVLESNETRTEDVKQRIGMLMKVAELWMTQKGKPDRAARAYEKVLTLDESNLDAAERLIPLYASSNNAKGLAGAIEVKLAHVQNPAERVDLLREVATLYGERLRDPGTAFERYLAALTLVPSDEQSQADAERAAQGTGRWDDLIQAYRKARIAAEEDRDFVTATTLRLKLGRVLVEEVSRIDEALAEYRAVYEAEPENALALEALESLYRHTERWKDLLDVYQKQRDLVVEPAERKGVLFRIADLYEQQMGDSAAAIETYQAALEEDPADPEALAALDRLYAKTEQWGPYAETLRRRMELDVSEEQLPDLKYRLGQVEEKHLGNPAAALENYREILVLAPEHDGARLALEGIMEAGGDLAGEAAAILESIYEAHGAWERLIQALEILARAADDPERKVELLRKVGLTAAGQLADAGRAYDALARALRIDPALEESRIELEAYAEQANAWQSLVKIYDEIASSVDDQDLARAFWLREAALEEQLAHVDEAAACYDKVLGLDAADQEALEALDALYRNNARYEALVGVYRRRIELADDAEQREVLYAEMAKVYVEQLGRPEEAIASYREVLTMDPTSQVALAALEGLFASQKMWSDLAENLETRLGLVETEEEQIGLMMRLAHLRETEMGYAESAIEGYRQVLERDGSHAGALQALERLGQKPEHEVDIAEILEPLYRQQGDYGKLIGVHEVQVRRAEDPLRKVELLHEISTLYEDAAGDAGSAFDVHARALAIEPANEVTQEGIGRLARVTNRFEDLAKVFEDLGSKQEDPALASQMYMVAARVVEGDLGDVDRAIGLYRKVLSIEPTNLNAAQALEALFQAAQRYPEMSLILQRKAEILEDIDEKKAALYQAASIEVELLGRTDTAIEVYRKVLEFDAEDLQSIDALIGLYLQMERWADLLAVYTKKADLVYEPSEKKDILYQVGAVYERELQDVGHAIDTYQRVLELDPDDLTALGRLDVLYQTAENWTELLSVLTHESELTSDAAEAIGFQYRIAELYEKRLNDVERAVELYREILNIQPDHAPTLEALEGIKAGTNAAMAAALVLEPVYEAMGEWQRLISVLEVQAKFTEDPFARVELLHRIAALYEESLGDHGGAFDVYARAVQVDSRNEETLGALERLAAGLERWPAVAALYDAELQKLEQPDERVELGLRVAQIYETQLQNLEAAVSRHRAVLEIEPENQTAVRSLDRLFATMERWQDLVEVLRREAEIGESPEEILDFKHRLGQVLQYHLADIDQAIAAYGEVIGAAPEHAATLTELEGLFAQGIKQREIGELLEPLYQASAEWEKLIQVHEAQLTNLTEPDERLQMYYRIAEDAEERLAEPVLAFDVYVRALREFPKDVRVGEEIERFAGVIDGGWEALANAYADVIGLEGVAQDVQASVGKRLARVFEEELADVQKAEESFRFVLSVAPGDTEALENLDRIFLATEQYAELAGILEQRVALAQEPPDKIELCRRLGQVYEEHLGQLDDAVVAFRRIFDDLEPTNEDAISALARVYEAKEAWPELAVVYQRQLENAVGDVEEAEIRAKMAHLAADRLGQIEQAMDGWKRVLDLRGEDPEALQALAGLYERQERWAELSDVLERHFDIASTDEERVWALTTRARLFTKRLGRDDEALETWQRVLDIDFSNVTALRAIADIWRRRENAAELVGALHMTVDRAAALLEPVELRELYRELGRTYTKVLTQPYEASEAWRHLLEVDPGDFEAMEELEKGYRADERWTDVVAVKMQRAEAFEAPEEKIRELLEVTKIWKKEIGEYGSATEAFEKILAIDPAHQHAFDELEKLHSAAGRWEPLIEMYLARLEILEEVADRSEMLRRIAKVFEEHLGDANQAFDALVNAFSDDYSDDATSAYLERMAQATSRWGELINTANAWLQEAEEPRTRIQLCLRLGKWYGEDLGRPEYAQPYYAQIMQLDPNNVRVIRQMANIYKISGQWQQMGETLTRALNIAAKSDDRSAILHDLGELLYTQMNQQDQGMTFYKRALEVDALYLPTLEALEKIYGEAGKHVELAEVLASKVKALPKGPEVVETNLRLGGLYEKQLGEAEKAVQAYRAALQGDDENLQALRGLERLYQKLERWSDLVEVLEQQLDVVGTERERVEALLKIAAIQEEHFLKADLAAKRLEQALELAPTTIDAYVALERCYRRLKQWLDLVNTYERHIAEVDATSDKIALFAAIATVHSEEVGDVEPAISAYQSIVDLDDTQIDAHEALAKLYEKQGEVALAIESMKRVADLTSDGSQRVEMYYRIGKALDEKLGDRREAQERFEMALELNPAHLPTLEALRTIATDEGDWERAAEYLEQEQTHTESPRARARLLVELGRVREEMLHEHEKAVQAWELAIQADDDCEEAALPLVEEYVRKERWDDAEPLAEMLVRKSKSRERHEQHMLYNLLGKVLAARNNNEKALKAYHSAHQLDMTDQETIRGIAEVSFRVEDWPTALTNYQKVLTALGEDEVDARTDVYYRLGCIKQGQGQSKQAINNFEKALALNSEHRATLQALVDIYSKNGDWKEVAGYKRQILDSVYDETERFTLLNEIGDVWAEKEKNLAKGIEAYEEALEYKAQDHILLHKLLQLYQQTQDWQKMVDTIQTIGGLESAPERKARYLYTMAQIYRDKLQDSGRAVELFNDALDLNPSQLEAFERINKVLTQEKNWKQLERNYRKMLHRIAGKGNTELEYNLWHQLGLIYRDRLGSVEPAVEAFKMAVVAKPGEQLERQILSELYEASERFDEAIEEQRTILAMDALRVDPYRALYRLYLHKQAYDEAWCIAAAMAFMRKATEEEQRFFEDYRPTGMLPVRGRLNNDMWSKFLFHTDEDLAISKIFEAIAGAALQAKIAQLQATRQSPVLSPKFKQDPATSTVTFAKTFGWAAQVLGIAAPELYVRSDVGGGIVAVPAYPPASVAGQGVLSGFQPQDLSFICGKHLAFYRGEHYIRTLFPTQAELTIMLFAAVMIAAPNTPMPPDIAKQVQTTAIELAKYMDPVQKEALRVVVKRFVDQGAKANIRAWSSGVELTACRAGLLLCGDLEIAKKIIAAEPATPIDLGAAEKIKDLLVFSVSPEYAALRRALGVGVAAE